MDKWTWRERIASWIHSVAYKVSPPVEQEILIRDVDGREIFSIAFEDSFVATGPRAPYTVHSREYADDEDLVGRVTDWD